MKIPRSFLLLAAFCLAGCGHPSMPESLARGPHPILVGPISEPIFRAQLARAERGDLTAIDIVTAYYYNNGRTDQAVKWEAAREIAAKNGKFRGKWSTYRP